MNRRDAMKALGAIAITPGLKIEAVEVQDGGEIAGFIFHVPIEGCVTPAQFGEAWEEAFKDSPLGKVPGVILTTIRGYNTRIEVLRVREESSGV